MKNCKLRGMVKIFKNSLVCLLGLLAAGPVWAQDYGLGAAAGGTGLVSKTLPQYLGGVVGAVLALVGTLFFLLMIYGGLMWMTSAGNEKQSTQAKDLLVAAVIGLLIVFAAYAITSFIGNAVTNT